MSPSLFRTLLVGTAVIVAGVILGTHVLNTSPSDPATAVSSVSASSRHSSSTSSDPCMARSSSSAHSSSSSKASDASSRHAQDPCVTVVPLPVPRPVAVSSVITDPPKPGLLPNPLSDPRLEPYFPVRITQTLPDGEAAIYEYADPYTYRESLLGSPHALAVNGKSFFFAEGMGWVIRHPGDYGYIEDPTLMLSAMLAFGLFPTINPDLGFVSTGQAPCKTAATKTCDKFVQSRTGFSLWVIADTQLLDSLDSGDGGSIAVAYNAPIVPVLEPATYVDFRNMMPPGMPTRL